MREILIAIGEDPDREGLLKTPDRVARAYAELMAGLNEDPRIASQDCVPRAIRRGRCCCATSSSIRSASIISCRLRAGPIVAYLPDGKVVGLSKLARLVEGYARRPQVQERLTTPDR